jgi:hypothetical protein
VRFWISWVFAVCSKIFAVLSSVKDCKDRELVPLNLVRNNVRRAGYDKFASFRFASGATEVRKFGKAFHGGKNQVRHSTRRCRLILFDKLANLGKVCDGSLGPDYWHDGGGNSRFLPQERSHRAVFSCETVRPACTSFKPLRMVASCHS